MIGTTRPVRQKGLIMPIPANAAEVLDRELLEIRARLLEVAAALDRVERASGSIEDDPRWAKIRQSLEVLANRGNDRAEQVQLLFSLPYDRQWQARFAEATD